MVPLLHRLIFKKKQEKKGNVGRKGGFVRGAQEWYTGIALSTVKMHTQPMAQWVNASTHIIGCIILYIYMYFLMGSILLLCIFLYLIFFVSPTATKDERFTCSRSLIFTLKSMSAVRAG